MELVALVVLVLMVDKGRRGPQLGVAEEVTRAPPLLSCCGIALCGRRAHRLLRERNLDLPQHLHVLGAHESLELRTNGKVEVREHGGGGEQEALERRPDAAEAALLPTDAHNVALVHLRVIRNVRVS